MLTEPQWLWLRCEDLYIVLRRNGRVQVLARYLSVVNYMRCGWQTVGISTVQIRVSQLYPRDDRGRTCVVDLEATASTDSA